MKKLILAAALCAAFTPSAYADAPKSDNDISFNANVITDYRPRGYSLTDNHPVAQVGGDWVNNPTGIYAGFWVSPVSFITDAGGKDRIESGIYAGKRGDIVNGFTYDVGVLQFVYPADGLATTPNTTEVHGQVGYGNAYVKYSYSLTNLFGFADSKGSGYLDIGDNFDLTNGYTLNLHTGYQSVANNANASYADWKIGVSKDYGIVNASFSVLSTNSHYYVDAAGKDLGKLAAIFTVGKTF